MRPARPRRWVAEACEMRSRYGGDIGEMQGRYSGDISAAPVRGRDLRDALEGERGTMGCSLRYVVMQPPLRRVAASVTCGCSPRHIVLQPALHSVAGLRDPLEAELGHARGRDVAHRLRGRVKVWVRVRVKGLRLGLGLGLGLG